MAGARQGRGRPPLGATRSARGENGLPVDGSMPQVDRCDPARATAWPLQSSSRRWVWLAAGERISRYAGRGQPELMVTSPVEIWSSVTLIPPASRPGRLRATQLPEAVPAGRGLREQRGFRPADRERIPGTSTRVTCRDVQGDIRPDHGRDRGQVVLVPQRWDSMSTRPISEADGNRLVLTVAEAADRLGISSDLAYDLVARGELPSLRLGRRIVIPRIALLAFVESATGSRRIHRGFRAVGQLKTQRSSSDGVLEAFGLCSPGGWGGWSK